MLFFFYIFIIKILRYLIPPPPQLVEVFGDEVQKVATVIPDMPMDHLLEMQVSLLTLAIKVYPRMLDVSPHLLEIYEYVLAFFLSSTFPPTCKVRSNTSTEFFVTAMR